MTDMSIKEPVTESSSNLVSRIFIAIALLALAGIFMALNACSVTENKVTFATGPSGVMAGAGDSTVTLTWNSVMGASSYRVYWNTSGGITTASSNFTVAATTYTHTGLNNGTTYYYRISAVASDGSQSPLSDEVSATPQVQRPSVPVITSATTSSGQVVLTWSAAERAQYYKVYWNTTGYVSSADQWIEVSGLTLTHSGLTNGVTYNYRVSAVNQSGESDLSTQVSATPSVTGGGGTSGGTSGGAGTSYNSNEWYDFNTASKGDWSGGTITFSITGLGYDMLPPGGDYFLFMAKMVTPNGNEGNFHYNIAALVPRLISQRFDGTCTVATHGRDFCEHQSHGSVNWNAAETYSFTFTWNTTDVYVDVRDSSGNVVHSGSVPTDGVYAGVSWIRVGNGVLPPYGGVSSPITVIGPVLQ